jgi:hypothetical protein
VALVEKWKLPEEIVACIREDEYDPENRSCIGNFVRFANAVVKLEGIYVGQVDPDEAQAMVLVGRSMLGMDEDVVSRVSGSLRERMERM